MADDNINPPPPPPLPPLPPEPAQERKQAVSAVGASGSRNAIALLVILLAAGMLVYLMFGQEDTAPKETVALDTKLEKAAPLPPPPPPPPPPTTPTHPPPPPPPPPPPSSSVTPTKQSGGQTARDQKIKSNGIIGSLSNTGGEALDENGKPKKANRDLGGVMVFDEEALKKTSAPQVEATVSGDPSTTVFQGKMIDAVLETAINTDLPGNLRAIVSRDIYAEEGNEVMIPKGSRLVGTYNTEVKRGQARVLIIWTRVIRPDGIDVAIASPGVDTLGRSGMAGEVDNKYMEVFGNAALLSTLSVVFAYGSEQVTGSKGTEQTTNSNGSTTTTGTNTDVAVQGAVEDFSKVAKGFIDGYLQVRPTITVDQGTKIKVFVNRDLLFPEGARNKVRVLQ